MEHLKFRTSSNEETQELVKYLKELGYYSLFGNASFENKRNIFAHANGQIFFDEYNHDTLQGFILDRHYKHYKHCRFIKKTIYSHEEVKEE